MPRNLDPDYRQVAFATFEYRKEAARICAQHQADYGKWLTTTLVAVHFGAVYLITQESGVPISTKVGLVALFSIGIIFGLTSGLFSFWNWQQNFRYHSQWLNTWILVDHDFWPTVSTPEGRERDRVLMESINRTYRCSIGFGVLSGACLLVAIPVLAKGMNLI
jgi:hypothetical protein